MAFTGVILIYGNAIDFRERETGGEFERFLMRSCMGICVVFIFFF